MVSELVDLEVGAVVECQFTNITGFLMWVQFDFRFGCNITVVVSVLFLVANVFSQTPQFKSF